MLFFLSWKILSFDRMIHFENWRKLRMVFGCWTISVNLSSCRPVFSIIYAGLHLWYGNASVVCAPRGMYYLYNYSECTFRILSTSICMLNYVWRNGLCAGFCTISLRRNLTSWYNSAFHLGLLWIYFYCCELIIVLFNIISNVHSYLIPTLFLNLYTSIYYHFCWNINRCSTVEAHPCNIS